MKNQKKKQFLCDYIFYCYCDFYFYYKKGRQNFFVAQGSQKPVFLGFLNKKRENVSKRKTI